ncbi:hypothetical protein ACGF8B_25545 [Streptomyces sp. NPDC047917]|uniref:hypothetical protein n=1 Tax=Streptomyces sp. NPDC047917 TaxID=3365491 RepID=UPI003714AB58
MKRRLVGRGGMRARRRPAPDLEPVITPLAAIARLGDGGEGPATDELLALSR